MGKSIKDFQSPEKLQLESTSIKLRKDQSKFIKIYGINLSKLVRSAIDDLMLQAKELEEKHEADSDDGDAA